MIKRLLTILVMGLFIVACEVDPQQTYNDCRERGRDEAMCGFQAFGSIFSGGLRSTRDDW